MTMITGALKYYTVAEAIRVAVDAALTNAVQRSCVVPGAIAWDECDCGMLAVSIGRVYLSDVFPDEQGSVTGNCQASMEVVEIVVQVIRCVPGPDDQGDPPTCAQLDTAAQIMAADTQQALAAIAVWICQALDTQIFYGLITPTLPQGPQGDCAGPELHVLIALPRG